MNKLESILNRLKNGKGLHYSLIKQEDDGGKTLYWFDNGLTATIRWGDYIIFELNDKKAIEYKPNFSKFWKFDVDLVNEIIENEIRAQ